MKLFKSTILAMLGMAVALTSCSDDEKYEPAAKTPGAYFAQNQATEISVKPDASSFVIPVYRTEDGGLTYNVTASGATDLFTVPASVSFNEGSYVTDMVILYDADKLEIGKPYDLKITVGDGTYVGRNSLDFKIIAQDPLIVEPYELGTGNYVYDGGIWAGVDVGLPINISYMPATPNNVTWTISDWGYGVDLNLVCEDITRTDEYGDIPFEVPVQFTGMTHATYGNIMVCDTYNFYLLMGAPNSAAKVKDASYYNKETGTFNLYVMYFGDAQDYKEGSCLALDHYEIFQLDGYPDYDISVEYQGLFTDRNENMSAKAVITCGEDVATVKTVMVAGEDAQEGVQAILTEAAGVQEFEGTATIDASYQVSKSGIYTIVAVAFDAKGEAQLYGADTFQISAGLGEDDSADWDDYGVADYADGWVTGAFSINGVVLNVEEYMFSVPVQKYVGETEFGAEAMYRLVQPYGADYFLADNNAYPAKRNIKFMIDDVYVAMEPQESGFGTASWGGQMVIGNWEGNLYANNEGVTVATCGKYVASKEAESLSSYEDGIVTIPLPMFGAPGIGNGSFGYSWKTVQNSVIIMPDATEAAAAHAKAARVAVPQVKGVIAKAQAVKVNIDKGKMMPRQMNTLRTPANIRVR